MSIIQFLRILWARKLIILSCCIFTFLGGLLVSLLMQPRYQATSRVMVTNILQPDPITGVAQNVRSMGAWVATQKELINDYAVSGPVVDRLNWLSDPGRIASYQGRDSSDTRDFRRWLAAQVAGRTSVGFQSGTVLEITFTSPSPAEAKIGAEALRDSYVDYALQKRREDATRNARWFSQQADLARRAAEEAELAKASYERANGIVTQGNQASALQDLDSARLNALVGQAVAAPAQAAARGVQSSSEATLQLAQIDAAIARNGERLGPNHPQMQQLRAQRDLVAKLVEQDAANTAAGGGNQAALAAISRELDQQKSIVIAQRDKIERIRQLQSEVDLRRDQYKKTAQRAADLMLQAGVADPGMTPIGVVVQPTTPSFPNKPLIIFGSLGLGAGMGLVLGVLIELLNRRVRGHEDLEGGLGMQCMAILGSATGKPAFKRWPMARRKKPVEVVA